MLVNVDFCQLSSKLFKLLPMIYEQFEDLPFRGSMARTSKHERNYNYGSKLSHFFRWLHRFAHSSVGKSFDMAYHYVCKKYPNNIGYISPKDEFKSEVNYYDDPWKNRWCRELYVDAEGVICDNKPEPRDRFLKVPVSEKKFYYKLKPMTLANEQRLYQWLAINFGRGPAVSVFVTGIIPPSIARYIFGTDHWRLQYTRNLDEVKSLFEKVDLTEYRVYERGTKAFKRYYAEQIKQFSRCSKKSSTQEQNTLDSAALALKKDNQSKKAKKAEIARARREEILRNIIDRDRLGFGEDSFMGPNYNSRKGKKEKRLLEGKDVV